MAKIFITGSADGLGQLAAKELIKNGHEVVLHARNENRGKDALSQLPNAKNVITGDLSNIEETILLAAKVNAVGRFDAIIHNAGLYNASPDKLFAVNTLAPYILTSLIHPPQRLIYLSSDMHHGGSSKLESFTSDIGRINYSDTKLHVLLLCKAVARKWADVYANAVHPGWVPTKMGGKTAPDDLQKGYETQFWLATSNEKDAKQSGRYFFHQKEVRSNAEADDEALQEEFLKMCNLVTNVTLKNY